MQKVIIIVEQASDGSFWCRTETDIVGIGLNACGKDVGAAKADLMECYEEAKADMEAQGKEMPEVEFVYKYDLQSFFNYFNFLNVTKNAGEKTYKRLSACVDNIKSELQAASF